MTSRAKKAALLFFSMIRMRKPLVLVLAVLPLAMACAHPSRQPTRAQTLYHEGQAFLSQGQPHEARARFSESLALCREQNDPRGIAHNLNEIGILYTQQRRCKEARACFREAEALYRRLGMDAEVSKCLNNRALTFFLEKSYDRAVEAYEGLLAWDESTGNHLGRAITYTNLGALYETRLDDPTGALEAYEKALTLLNALGDASRGETVKERLKRLQNAWPALEE
jgi:tetratricopeptide (TPR) repeat protein